MAPELNEQQRQENGRQLSLSRKLDLVRALRAFLRVCNEHSSPLKAVKTDVYHQVPFLKLNKETKHF